MIQSVQTDISEIGRNLNISTTILDKTLETIPANITKLLNIDKTNFVSPSPPVQCYEQRRNNFW
jgi:hypothetical protein